MDICFLKCGFLNISHYMYMLYLFWSWLVTSDALFLVKGKKGQFFIIYSRTVKPVGVEFHWANCQDFLGGLSSSLVGTGPDRAECCHRPTGIHWLLTFWTRVVSILVTDFLAGPSLNFIPTTFCDWFCWCIYMQWKKKTNWALTFSVWLQYW